MYGRFWVFTEVVETPTLNIKCGSLSTIEHNDFNFERIIFFKLNDLKLPDTEPSALLISEGFLRVFQGFDGSISLRLV
jgi:hypothetical protein